jgi:hypothetical protein
MSESVRPSEMNASPGGITTKLYQCLTCWFRRLETRDKVSTILTASILIATIVYAVAAVKGCEATREDLRAYVTTVSMTTQGLVHAEKPPKNQNIFKAPPFPIKHGPPSSFYTLDAVSRASKLGQNSSAGSYIRSRIQNWRFGYTALQNSFLP